MYFYELLCGVSVYFIFEFMGSKNESKLKSASPPESFYYLTLFASLVMGAIFF